MPVENRKPLNFDVQVSDSEAPGGRARPSREMAAFNSGSIGEKLLEAFKT